VTELFIDFFWFLILVEHRQGDVTLLPSDPRYAAPHLSCFPSPQLQKKDSSRLKPHKKHDTMWWLFLDDEEVLRVAKILMKPRERIHLMVTSDTPLMHPDGSTFSCAEIARWLFAERQRRAALPPAPPPVSRPKTKRQVPKAKRHVTKMPRDEPPETQPHDVAQQDEPRTTQPPETQPHTSPLDAI